MLEWRRSEQTPASVYTLKNGKQLLYVGVDRSANQNRVSQHFSAAKKIAQDHQAIDIALALLDPQQVIVEILQCNSGVDALELEAELINERKPLWNVMGAGKEYVCRACDKIYKSRTPFIKHVAGCCA